MSAHKKDSEESEKQPETAALEQKVDAMMKPEQSDSVGASGVIRPSSNDQAIDIFKDQPGKRPSEAKTAPDVPPALLKKIDIKPSETAQTEKPRAKPSDEDLLTSAEEPTTEPVSTAEDQPHDDTLLEDSATDKAVEDIVAKEGDVVLAAEDAAAHRSNKLVNRPSGWKTKVKALIRDKRFWIALAVLLLLSFAVPATRYKLIGLLIKRPVTITVLDSKTNTPVSSATVELGGATGKTDANGKASVKSSPGKHSLKIDKHYYKAYSSPIFVSLGSNHSSKVELTATGRQVPIVVLNKITDKPLANAVIKVLKTTAKTDAKGKATVVLPATTDNDNATASLNGYNTAQVKIEVTDKVVAANTFRLTPAGKIYFLSNLNGDIDVVKANLDGTGRKTVLEGTGKEDGQSTSLLASRDWRYLVLKSRRDSAKAALYIIDTAGDKVTKFDSGDAEFTLVGWYGHNFIYDIVRSGVAQSQSGREVLKSYDAEHSQLNQLDQNQAEGNASSYAYQGFYNFYILGGGLVVYNTQWYTYNSGGGYDLAGKNDTIRAVQANGQNKKDYQAFPAGNIGYIQAALYEPQAIYFAVYSNSDNKTTYYHFEDKAVASSNNIDQSTFNKQYPTYLISPSGNTSFWSELRDGKNTLFTGGVNAERKKLIASLSEYTPYGWHSDNYLLVSKNSSELYVMPAGGLAKNRKPLKVSDYYKPAQTYNGYGYGYGGL